MGEPVSVSVDDEVVHLDTDPAPLGAHRAPLERRAGEGTAAARPR